MVFQGSLEVSEGNVADVLFSEHRPAPRDPDAYLRKDRGGDWLCAEVGALIGVGVD